MTSKVKELFKSFCQTIKIIEYARLPTSMLSKQSAEYFDRCTYNSYIRMLRIRFKEDTVNVKIRVPEGNLTFDMSDLKFQRIVQRIKMMNSEYIFSAPEYRNVFYIEFSGTKFERSAPAA